MTSLSEQHASAQLGLEEEGFCFFVDGDKTLGISATHQDSEYDLSQLILDQRLWKYIVSITRKHIAFAINAPGRFDIQDMNQYTSTSPEMAEPVDDTLRRKSASNLHVGDLDDSDITLICKPERHIARYPTIICDFKDRAHDVFRTDDNEALRRDPRIFFHVWRRLQQQFLFFMNSKEKEFKDYYHAAGSTFVLESVPADMPPCQEGIYVFRLQSNASYPLTSL